MINTLRTGRPRASRSLLTVNQVRTEPGASVLEPCLHTCVGATRGFSGCHNCVDCSDSQSRSELVEDRKDIVNNIATQTVQVPVHAVRASIEGLQAFWISFVSQQGCSIFKD